MPVRCSTPETMIDAFVTYGVPEFLARHAVTRLHEDNLHVVAITGKISSGKDTLAPLVLADLGAPDAQHVYFAQTLKVEVTEVIAILAADLRNGVTNEDMAKHIVDAQNIKFIDARQIILFLLPEMLSDNPPADAWTRTEGVRRALQYWGTEIRRTADDLYFVKKSIAAIADILISGRSAYVTDARFVNEADALVSIGAAVVRVEVTLETQRARLGSRDGLVLTDEAAAHPSETALDDYDNFDVRIDNNSISAEEATRLIVQNLLS